MSDSEERVQEALAAHLEHVELGGPDPDVSHLTSAEQEDLRGLIRLLDQTEGVAFGLGLGAAPPERLAATPAGEQLLSLLHDALPTAVRISGDAAAATSAIPGMAVVEGWIVGTIGGRIRVWLLGPEGALEANEAWLRDLDRVFRLLPDTAAIALVDPHLQCLLVQPEDCAPAIEVPLGSLFARRYRRPVQPVGDALETFLRELIPHWDPVPGLAPDDSLRLDLPGIAGEQSARAIQDQVAAGARARRTNPKRQALSGLGDREAERLAGLVLAVYEGRVAPGDVAPALLGLAARR